MFRIRHGTYYRPFPVRCQTFASRIAFAITEEGEEHGDAEVFKNTPCLPASAYSVFCAAGNGAGDERGRLGTDTTARQLSVPCSDGIYRMRVVGHLCYT